MTDYTLSESEREAISQALRTCRIDDPAPIRLIHERDVHHVTHMAGAAVEAIIAARLAPVEALAETWEADPDGLPRADGCARQLRAALAPQPAPEVGA